MRLRIHGQTPAGTVLDGRTLRSGAHMLLAEVGRGEHDQPGEGQAADPVTSVEALLEGRPQLSASLKVLHAVRGCLRESLR